MTITTSTRNSTYQRVDPSALSEKDKMGLVMSGMAWMAVREMMANEPETVPQEVGKDIAEMIPAYITPLARIGLVFPVYVWDLIRDELYRDNSPIAFLLATRVDRYLGHYGWPS